MICSSNDKFSTVTENKLETKKATRCCAISLDPNELRFLRPKDVAEVLGLSRQTLYRMRRSGTFISPVKIGDCSVAYRSDQLLKWMNRRELVDEIKEGVKQPHPTPSKHILDENAQTRT